MNNDKEKDSDHFFVGTEQGVMLECDTHGIVSEYPSVCSSIVTDIHASPSDSRILLSSGPWFFAVWRVGTQQPLLLSPPSSSRISAGRWSSSRPAVFYISKYDGTLEAWDVLDRTHSVALAKDVSGDSILVMEPVVIRDSRGHTQHLIGLGDTTGTLRILEIPRSFIRCSKKEKKFVDTWLSREIDRVMSVPIEYGYGMTKSSDVVTDEPSVDEDDDEAALIELNRMRIEFLRLLPSI